MILESVLWLPSMFPGTLSDFMNEERKRMNALGGRGIWPASRFFAWEGLTAAAVAASVAVAEMRGVSSSDISSKRGVGSGIASAGLRDEFGLYGMVAKSASNEYGKDIIGIVVIRGGGGRSTRGGISSVETSGVRDGMEWGLRGWQGYERCEKRLPSSGMSTNASSTN